MLTRVPHLGEVSRQLVHALATDSGGRRGKGVLEVSGGSQLHWAGGHPRGHQGGTKGARQGAAVPHLQAGLEAGAQRLDVRHGRPLLQLAVLPVRGGVQVHLACVGWGGGRGGEVEGGGKRRGGEVRWSGKGPHRGAREGPSKGG